MTKTVLITGGTGELGKALVPRLLAAGYKVCIGSRRAAPTELPDGVSWAQMDLATGEGVAKANIADIIIHAASSPFRNTDATDVEGAKRLLEVAKEPEYFLYISIVGVDKIPYRYYRYKVATEEVVAQGQVPWGILRATQFHSLLDMGLAAQRKWPFFLVPKGYNFQPIATKEVADVMVTAVIERQLGHLPDLAGPESRPATELAQMWQASQGLNKPIWQLPMLTKAARAFQAGHHTLPERPFGTITWQDWLAAKYGIARGQKYEATKP
ncbi:MAG: NAD(P)H-binding protein [Chloroflexota bacterium]